MLSAPVGPVDPVGPGTVLSAPVGPVDPVGPGTVLSAPVGPVGPVVAIVQILRARGQPQVLASIVQPLAVDVVGLFALGKRTPKLPGEHHSVHILARTPSIFPARMPPSIDCMSASTHVPLERIQRLVILVIYDCDPALS